MFHTDGWEFDHAVVHDSDPASANSLKCFLDDLGMPAVECKDLSAALSADIVVFATTAPEPYVKKPFQFHTNQVILNISLRDIAPEVLLDAENICDDVEHCMKANTSPHLAEQLTGGRAFMKGTLASLIRGEIALCDGKPSIFSPFGLGVLDLDLGKFVVEKAIEAESALTIDSFFAESQRW
jgi:ornithine cyclodeaminase/alanine dehydrogenase-like protein (mu-crystallin family)